MLLLINLILIPLERNNLKMSTLDSICRYMLSSLPLEYKKMHILTQAKKKTMLFLSLKWKRTLLFLVHSCISFIMGKTT